MAIAWCGEGQLGGAEAPQQERERDRARDARRDGEAAQIQGADAASSRRHGRHVVLPGG